jgi:large subunit ribosomal protein L20
MRVKSAGPQRRQRRKRILKFAKGFRGRRKNTIRRGMEAVERSLKNATAHRKVRKRDFRKLWIARINAAARLSGVSYSRFINGLKQAGVNLDRKVLAEIAWHDPAGFAAIADLAKQASARQAA